MADDNMKVLVVPGEWAGDVAAAASIVGSIAAIASTVFFWTTVLSIDLTAPGRVVADSSWVDGSFAQRATMIVVLMALWLASLVFIAAAVLAVIETRAVTQRTVVSEAPDGGENGFNTASVGGAVSAVTGLAEKLTRARGTVVLGVSGMVVAVAAFTVLGMVFVADGGGTVPDGAGQTATPTGDGTGETAPPAEDGGARTGAPQAPTDDGTAPGDDEPSPTG